jgi:hypothetical protein
MEMAFASALSGGLSSVFGASAASATAMQGGATAFSVLSQITSGRMARNSGDQAASMSYYAADFARGEGEIASRQAAIDARQETIAGRARASQLEEDLVHTLSGQRVAYAAAGGDPFSGTAARIAEQTDRRGQEDIKLERSNTELARVQALIRGSTAKRSSEIAAMTQEANGRTSAARGANQELISLMGAGERVFNYKASVAQRK